MVKTDVVNVGTRYAALLFSVKKAWRLTYAREKMYSQGGVFSITSRILIVDLLSSKTTAYPFIEPAMTGLADLLVPETITGMIVLHADRLVYSGSIAPVYLS